MTSAADTSPDWAFVVSELIQARQTVLPKRLMDPGPDAAQTQAILAAAAAAPDHMQLLPWRFILVPVDQRATLAEVFARALSERDPSGNSPARIRPKRSRFSSTVRLR